jgi:hypothetical protein
MDVKSFYNIGPRWCIFSDVALLQFFSINSGFKVDCRNLAHEAIALLRSGLDGNVRDGDAFSWNPMFFRNSSLKRVKTNKI